LNGVEKWEKWRYTVLYGTYNHKILTWHIVSMPMNVLQQRTDS
jgi:hypothetical protein